MPEFLFLAQRLPYPPDKGDKIRSYRLLRRLAERGRVRLGAFVDDEADLVHLPALREFCADAHIARLDPRLAKLRCLTGFATGAPLSLGYYRDRGLADWVGRVLRETRPDAVLVFSSAMAQFVLDRPEAPPFVMDFVDVDSDKWRQYADTLAPPLSWVYRREWRRLLEFDRRVARAALAGTFVSEPEAELFRRLAPESADKTYAVANGVDADYFSPERQYVRPLPEGRPSFVFTGAMDYWPNVDAVVWFAEAMLPRIRAKLPEAEFWIVGANPAPAVEKLRSLPGVTVTGRVPDVRPYLAQATAAVAPLRISRGVQNKVLEAMAMARPVLVTPQALEGIDAAPGRELALADGEEAFADAAVRAARGELDPGMGAAARACVIAHFSWPARLAGLDRLLDQAMEGRRR
jgi:sugar transferase (PEP-CTERM/EpsH1 system associated)